MGLAGCKNARVEDVCYEGACYTVVSMVTKWEHCWEVAGQGTEDEMPKSLHDTVALLQAHEADLHQRGVRHVAVFGSVARGDARPNSDTDILIELDPAYPLGLFAYASLTRYITDLVGAPVDVVNRHTVKTRLRETIDREAVDVF
jgi:predicted nucleotidyltransferase